MTIPIPPSASQLPGSAPILPTQPAPATQAPATPVAEQPAEAPATPAETLETTPLAGAATAPQVALIDAPQISAAERFQQDFKLAGKGYLPAGDSRLAQTLKSLHQGLTEDKKRALGANPRGLDFMHALEKAATGKKLNRDDIESVQLFLVKDTRYGAELSYGGNEGIDGKYGQRTHHALQRLLQNFQPSDLVPDPYYQELDRKGVAYAKYQG